MRSDIRESNPRQDIWSQATERPPAGAPNFALVSAKIATFLQFHDREIHSDLFSIILAL